jgi:hypothetical protein
VRRGRASPAKQGERQEYIDVLSLHRQSLQNKQCFHNLYAYLSAARNKMYGRDLFYSPIYPSPPLCFNFPIRKVCTRPHQARPKAFGLAGRPVGSTGLGLELVLNRNAPMKSLETGQPEANQAPFRTRNWSPARLFLGHSPQAISRLWDYEVVGIFGYRSRAS